jgi:hypothetical protein
VPLDGNEVGTLAFFEGRCVVATAPSEEKARKLLGECHCAAPENGAVTNVFACGSAGRPLDLEELREESRGGGGGTARFDGTRARSVLRIATEGVQLDAFCTGRYTLKGPSVLAVESASASFQTLLRRGF